MTELEFKRLSDAEKIKLIERIQLDYPFDANEQKWMELQKLNIKMKSGE